MRIICNIAAMSLLSGLALAAGAQELNGLKAADVAVRSEAADVIQPTEPVRPDSAPAEGAGDCGERLTDTNWPEDRRQLVLSCERAENSGGYGRACFAVTNPQYEYTDTLFKTVRFEAGQPGQETSLATLRVDGSVSPGSRIRRQGSTIEISTRRKALFGHSWTEKITVTLNSPSTLKFEVYETGLFGDKRSAFWAYSCRVLRSAP